MATDQDIRLPKSVKPLSYYITLEPNLQSFTFSGQETIFIEILEETFEITLNAKDLRINSAWYTKDEFVKHAKQIVVDEKNERVNFVFDSPLLPGKAWLKLDFVGAINDQLAGFYRSTYEVNGEKKVLAVTQFEDTDARRAFPCWDEPAIKAEFYLTLVIPKNLNALSNMPIKEELACGGDRKAVHFERTPIMSSYLLAFAVGEFEHIETRTKDGTLVRVFTTRGKSEEGRFALDVGVRAIEFYNEYFDIPYPLPKLDMIAIPDFAAGAMENWGFVTYREAYLLFNDKRSSQAVKYHIAYIVTHEIAHQWFGNLVTMEWWTYLWLNEGFASWMEYLAVDNLFPEWNVWELIFMNNESALGLDGLRTTHPIEVEIKHPSEIGQNFDEISYSKGAAVIHMLYSYIGPEAFREGLQVYLKRHAYGNTTTEDLWQAFEEVSGKPVIEVMDTWIKQPGYPVVKVEPLKRSGLLLSQERFLLSGAELLSQEREQLWHIVMRAQTKKGLVPIEFNVSSAKSNIKPFLCSWVKLNAKQTALARVEYTPKLLEHIRKVIWKKVLSNTDKAGILSDLYAFSEAGRISVTKLLSFLEKAYNETSYIVWSGITESLYGISSLLPEKGESRDNFNFFARGILKKIVSERGWEEKSGEIYADILLRPMVIGALGYCGDVETIEEANRRFELFVVDATTLHPDLRQLVLSLVARRGDSSIFNILTGKYHSCERSEDKYAFLGALGSFENPELISKALEFSLSDMVRSQDLFYILDPLASNTKIGSLLTWEFSKKHWEELERRYSGGGIFMLAGLIETILGGFDSEEGAKEVEEFFKEHPIPEASQAITQLLERIRSYAARIKRDRPIIEEWLSKWIRNKS